MVGRDASGRGRYRLLAAMVGGRLAPAETGGGAGGDGVRGGWGGGRRHLEPPARTGTRVEQDQGATRSHCGQAQSLTQRTAT
jgi:hypothetical protein